MIVANRNRNVRSISANSPRCAIFVARFTTPSETLERYAAPVNEQLLTVQDVAFRLRITPETVRRWLRTGKLRGALLGGDKMGYRIAEGEVIRLLDSAAKAATHE